MVRSSPSTTTGEPKYGRIDYITAYEIADAEGNSAYEALLYMNEDGAVCITNTTRSVMYACQRRLSCNISEPVMEALHAVLRERP